MGLLDWLDNAHVSESELGQLLSLGNLDLVDNIFLRQRAQPQSIVNTTSNNYEFECESNVTYIFWTASVSNSTVAPDAVVNFTTWGGLGGNANFWWPENTSKAVMAANRYYEIVETGTFPVVIPGGTTIKLTDNNWAAGRTTRWWLLYTKLQIDLVNRRITL